MSTKVEKRRIARAYGCEVKRIGDGRVSFTVHGDTANGRMTEFVIESSFSNWTCVARGFAKAWEVEKADRLSQIARIDGALPKETA